MISRASRWAAVLLIVAVNEYATAAVPAPPVAPARSVLDLPRLQAGQKAGEPPPALSANATKAGPAAVRDSVAWVGETNLIWAPQGSVFLALHQFLAHNATTPITTEKSAVGTLLRQWEQNGTAAGLHGFLYDNLDRDHSNMDYGRFPQLARVEYDAAVRQRGYEYGLARFFLHGAPTLGNSSTAHVAGPFWRSQTRFALSNPRLVAALYQQYANNHLYFYPEHRDHDADGHGDVFHANTPYAITSQGSSGSDQAFMHAFANIFAAFAPETQRLLIEKKLLMPTAQMVFRMGRKPVVKPEDYLTGKAHPPVFAQESLDVERMVRLAHALKPGDIPPTLQLRVVQEDAADPGVDYFEPGEAEKVFDTPCAIARVMRAARWQRRMIVSAEDTRDPNQKPLTFVWRVLCGNATHVKVRPLNPQGSRAEILIEWHERRAIEAGGNLFTSRVDVGVFAHNGAQHSAPSFISWLLPANERRVYNDQHQLRSIEYLPQDKKEQYVDPMLITPVVWQDEYQHDAQGRLLGWTRARGAAREDFTRHGALVLRRDAQGRPAEARTVRYVRKQDAPAAAPTLAQEPGEEILHYTYRDEKDLLGEAARKSVPKNPAPK